MTYETIKKTFEEKKELKFKLYSLEYEVKLVDNKVIVYSILYQNRSKIYNSLDEAFNNFYVYNISLIDSLDRIKIL